MAKACVIDDSPVLAAQLSALLATQGISSEWVKPSAVGSSLPAGTELVFVALQLRADNGFRLLRQLADSSACQLVGVSGSGRQSDVCWAGLAGAAVVLERPLEQGKLAACLQSLRPSATRDDS